MITIQDIKNTSFRKSVFGGYKPEDVDNFIDEVLTSYEEIEREKRNLNLVIQKLEKQVRDFHEEEKSMKEIVSDLKNVIDKSISETEIKAKGIIDDAVETSENIIESAKKEVAIQENISNNLKKESKRLKESLEEVYKKHLEIMSNISYNCAETENIISASDNTEIIDTTCNMDSKLDKEKKIISSDIDENKVSGGMSSKFQNLEFGDKYRNKSVNDNGGVYGGIFKDSN